MKPSLCLNMIVRNESARILRCISSVAPYIQSYSIFDTGSTDGTTNIIRDYFDEIGIKGHVHFGTFTDFSQARNEAFRYAKDDNGQDGAIWSQFALLMDADMELVVESPHGLMSLDKTALSYSMVQKGGVISYHNTRIVNLERVRHDPYVGVTHEYLDVHSTSLIGGAFFLDHADGANRVNKATRDIRLLLKGLDEEPDNGRYMFYLANSYKDAGQVDLAAAMYQRRIDKGGWNEETHAAMMGLAFAEKDGCNFGGFVDAMIQAHNFRPERAEPLYELAKAYRDRNQQRAGLVFAKAGLNIKRPNDLLFVNDYVYSHGLRYEFSILGYYADEDRDRAFEVTDDLALDPECPWSERAGAKTNLFWYLKPLSTYCPSFRPTKLDFIPPSGYTAMNPSIEVCNEKITCNIRCVNYRMDEHGRYMIGPKDCSEAPIDTRNFLVQLREDFRPWPNPHGTEIIWDRPEPQFPQVTGLEDIRLYRVKGNLCFSACIREQEATGMPQQVRGVIEDGEVVSWAKMSAADVCEKNWMPIQNNSQDFVYRLDTIAHTWDLTAPRGVTKTDSKLYVSEISGGSQAIPFKNGYIAVVHEASTDPTNNKRTYWHRFAWFTKDMELKRLSLPFVFFDKQIEFCCGLAYHPDRNSLIISFGVRDAEAWVAKVAVEEVARMCWKFHEA